MTAVASGELDCSHAPHFLFGSSRLSPGQDSASQEVLVKKRLQLVACGEVSLSLSALLGL